MMTLFSTQIPFLLQYIPVFLNKINKNVVGQGSLEREMEKKGTILIWKMWMQ